MTKASLSRTLQLLHRIVLPLDRLLQTADRESGCTAAQLSILAGVHYLGRTTLNRLAARERISAPTASRIVEGLVREGLLSRGVEAGDRRAVRLEVTKAGVRAIEIACAAREKVLDEALKDLTEDERAALKVAVPGLNRTLGLVPEQAGSEAP